MSALPATLSPNAPVCTQALRLAQIIHHGIELSTTKPERMATGTIHGEPASFCVELDGALYRVTVDLERNALRSEGEAA